MQFSSAQAQWQFECSLIVCALLQRRYRDALAIARSLQNQMKRGQA